MSKTVDIKQLDWLPIVVREAQETFTVNFVTKVHNKTHA